MKPALASLWTRSSTSAPVPQDVRAPLQPLIMRREALKRPPEVSQCVTSRLSAAARARHCSSGWILIRFPNSGVVCNCVGVIGPLRCSVAFSIRQEVMDFHRNPRGSFTNAPPQETPSRLPPLATIHPPTMTSFELLRLLLLPSPHQPNSFVVTVSH